jgi:hypothetical protein
MYDIESLKDSVEDIYGQLDRGQISEEDAIEIVKRCCNEFLLRNPQSFTSDADINMTSYKGYIVTTYQELCEVFGPPDDGPNDLDADKVTCCWRLKFADGTVASIYDWKTGSTPFGEYDWHIGGHNIKAVNRVKTAMRSVRVDSISIEKK